MVMLSWFREWCRPVASAALASLVTLTVSSAIPHETDCHGAECAAVAWHDPSGHSIGGSQQASEHENHCIACHWTRTVRPAPETAQLFVPVVAEDARIAIDAVSIVPQAWLSRPSLRAPPVFPGCA